MWERRRLWLNIRYHKHAAGIAAKLRINYDVVCRI